MRSAIWTARRRVWSTSRESLPSTATSTRCGPGFSKTCVKETTRVAPAVPPGARSTGSFWRAWPKSSTSRHTLRFSGAGLELRTVTSRRTGIPTARVGVMMAASVTATFSKDASVARMTATGTSGCLAGSSNFARPSQERAWRSVRTQMPLVGGAGLVEQGVGGLHGGHEVGPAAGDRRPVDVLEELGAVGQEPVGHGGQAGVREEDRGLGGPGAAVVEDGPGLLLGLGKPRVLLEPDVHRVRVVEDEDGSGRLRVGKEAIRFGDERPGQGHRQGGKEDHAQEHQQDVLEVPAARGLLGGALEEPQRRKRHLRRPGPCGSGG